MKGSPTHGVDLHAAADHLPPELLGRSQGWGLVLCLSRDSVRIPPAARSRVRHRRERAATPRAGSWLIACDNGWRLFGVYPLDVHLDGTVEGPGWDSNSRVRSWFSAWRVLRIQVARIRFVGLDTWQGSATCCP